MLGASVLESAQVLYLSKPLGARDVEPGPGRVPHSQPASLRPQSRVTHRVDDLADRVDHELRLLLVYLVAAICVRDVLRVRHELGELLLCLFLRVVGDVAKVRRNVSWQLARSNQRRNLWPPRPVRSQNYQPERTQWLGGADLVEAAVRGVPFQVWVQCQALPYVAFHH